MKNQDRFDQIVPRRNTDSIKWNLYPEDVIPLWIADMDFQSPPEIIQALHERIDHGIFGYGSPSAALSDTIINHMQKEFNWAIQAEWIVWLPGLVTGLNLFCKAISQTHTQVIVQPPVYPPLHLAPAASGLNPVYSPLVQNLDGRYEMDFTDLEEKMRGGTRSMILCNPHNPVGRVFSRDELHQLAELCEKYNVILCSDEIHCDLVLKGFNHTPVASLSETIGDKTITLMAPSKTYNIAGLGCSFAIVPNEDLRKSFKQASWGIVPHVNILGLSAAEAAYKYGKPWVDEVLRTLENNYAYLSKFVREKLSPISMQSVEGTYLAWLDCRKLNLDNPSQFFLEKCKVALNNGADFGEPGKGFVRLNFACPKTILDQALNQMEKGLRETGYTK
jgi:cystathionine beta-lyase